MSAKLTSSLQERQDEIGPYPTSQQILDRVKDLGPKETFSDLWRDDFLQVTSRVARRTLRRLNLKPYSQAVFERGLKMRTDKEDGEEHELLDWAMEYTGTVGLEVTDMLMTVNEKVHALEP